MQRLYPASERGHADFGWLDSHHTFSFGDYYDPKKQGFRALRVINDDRVEPGAGFGTHPHRDMEIVSYVLEGALEHADSLGTRGVLRRGDVQRMSAGTGVRHSEFNGSKTEGVHFLQIWLLPAKPGTPPSYEQKLFPDEERRGRLRLLVSPDAADGSLRIGQDASILGALLAAGDKVSRPVAKGRHAYVHLAEGRVTVNGTPLATGDGLALSAEDAVEIVAVEASELLLFDLA